MSLANKVLVLRSELLPYSETFIKAQVLAYATWKPILVGTRYIDGGLSLDGLDVRLLPDHARTFVGGSYARVLRALRMAPPGVIPFLRDEGASLIHVHFATDAVMFWPIIRRLNLPIVVTMHGFDINTYREWWEKDWPTYSGRRYPARLLRLSVNPQIHFVAVSESIRQRAIEYGISADKISVRYIGIDLGAFKNRGRPASQRGRRILYVGRLIEKKGGQHLIRAVARLRDIVPDVTLVMIGDGPLMNDYVSLARELVAPVEFLGSVSSSEVQNQMAQARVFCLPSITAQNGDAEGLPISVLEAQACGVPVVTSARGGATEGIVDGVTGYAFPEGDEAILFDKLLKLMQDDNKVDSMSFEASKFIAERFDITRCTRSLEELYGSLVS